MPKISVIIPVYNVEKYLPRCLDSIVNQTFKDIEIICVNDGSTDDSSKILEQYAKKDKRITIITQKNSGPSSARNTGLKHARGEYIGFIDSDDWVDTNFYELLLKNIDMNDADIAIAGIKIVDGQTLGLNSNKTLITKELNQKIKNLPNGSVCDKLFKAGLFRNIEFPIGRYYEDNIVLLKTIYYSNVVAFTNCVSYYYFINQSGTCRTTNLEKLSKKNEDRLYSARSMMDFAKKHGLGQSRVVKDFILRTVICEFISKKSPYYHKVQQILGKFYVYHIKIKKLLHKIVKIFYKVDTK